MESGNPEMLWCLCFREMKQSLRTEKLTKMILNLFVDVIVLPCNGVVIVYAEYAIIRIPPILDLRGFQG